MNQHQCSPTQGRELPEGVESVRGQLGCTLPIAWVTSYPSALGHRLPRGVGPIRRSPKHSASISKVKP